MGSRLRISLAATVICAMALGLLQCNRDRGASAGTVSVPTLAQVPEAPNPMTVDELIHHHGSPVTRVDSDERPGAQIFELAGGQSCEVQGGHVVACFRAPMADEMTLQYWRHLWRGVEQDYEELPARAPASDDARLDFQLTAPTLGASIIYSPGQDRVVKVVSYGRTHPANGAADATSSTRTE